MTDTKSRDLFPGALEMMALRLLKREPMHGYALVQRIQQASNDLLQVEEGSLYPALQRLLKDGLVGLSSDRLREEVAQMQSEMTASLLNLGAKKAFVANAPKCPTG